MPTLDEELNQVAEEASRKQQLEVVKQQDRMRIAQQAATLNQVSQLDARQSASQQEDDSEQDAQSTPEDRNQSRSNPLKDAAQNRLKEKAKKELEKRAVRQLEKQVAKTAAKQVIRKGIWELVIAFFSEPVGWAVLGIIFLIIFIIGLIILVITSMSSICQAADSYIPDFALEQVCPPELYRIPDVENSISPSSQLTLLEGYVFLDAIGIPWAGIVAPNEPKVKQSIADKLVRLKALSDAEGLTWVVTSAYRAGVGSCHNLGEAVDIGLRPVPAPVAGRTNSAGKPLYNDPRIKQLMDLAYLAGFAFRLDEYNFPSGNAVGGHVHLSIGGYEYCKDNDS